MKLRKTLSAIVACVMAASVMAVPAFAADAKTGSTQITATVTGDYTLTVPQTVAMTGSAGTGEKSATVTVNIKGDIAEDKQVTVTTTAPVMKRTGSKDVTATVTAPKTAWTRTDLLANSNAGTTSNYVVKATLTPGDWTGTLVFNCSLDAVKA